MVPRYDGYYQSGLTEHTEWHAGAERCDKYYTWLKFVDDGFYIQKDFFRPAFDFVGLLKTLDIERIKRNYPQKEPLDSDYSPLYKVGRFVVGHNELLLTWKWSIGSGANPRWVDEPRTLRVVSAEFLVDDLYNVAHVFRNE